MKTAQTAAALALFALMGNAYADTATCPPISTIKQEASGNGYTYLAPGPNGQNWEGVNPQAQSSFLADSQFKNAKYKDDTKAVICSYEGEGAAGVRVTLKPVKDWSKAPNTSWKDVVEDTLKNAECRASDISQCSFTYSK